MSSFSIGVSAMAAAQAGLLTTEHNISNVNTPGFHRQQAVQSANIAQYSSIGYLGQGVHIDTVKRIYDQMLDGQLQQAQAIASQLDSYYSQVKQLDNMLANPDAGVSPALQGFFNGVHDVAANPASIPSRQAMLSSAQMMAARFQSVNQRFTEIRDGVNSQIASNVGIINSYAQQITSINQQIVNSQGSSSNQQPANDLMDQRDQMIAELNQVIKVATVMQDNGSMNVFIGNGQPLVIGALAFTLGAIASPEDPGRMEVGMSAGGSAVQFPKGSLTGGVLGGLLLFRDDMLDPAQNALGRTAIGLAQTFNDQHKLGMDLNGSLGGDFFNVASPRVLSSTNNSVPATNANVSYADVGLLTTSDYSLQATGAATFSLTRLSDGATLFSGLGLPQTVDGITISGVSGVVAAGDSFLIQPTRNGARDISVKLTDTTAIAAAAPIKTNATLSNAGFGQISAGSVNTPPPPNANLLQPVTITFTGPGTFDVAGVGAGLPAVGQVYTSGNPITYNGWTIKITGAPVAGDTFTVGTNAGGIADNRNALLLAGLQTQNTLAGNTTTYQGAYSQLVSLVGNKTHQIDVTSKAQANLVLQTQQAQQSLSGVNLDEEAANLIRFQQAYQAAGKMMQISSTLFASLLNLGQ